MYIQSKDLVSLLIEPTGFCNAKCPHCPRYTDDGFLHDYIPEQHLTIGAFTHGLDPAKLTNLKLVEFAGATGDPAINPHIEDLVEFFNFVPTVSMDTNGSLRSKKWWARLARFTNLTVVWSIDGLADTNHLYRVGTDYKKIIANAQAFIAAGGKAVWKCVVFKHNQHQLEEIKQLALSLGFVGVRFIRAYDYRFQDQLVWPVYVQGKYLHTIEPSTLLENEIVAFNMLPDYFKRSPRQPAEVLCPWLKDRSAYINLLGELMPCCMMTHETTDPSPGRDMFLQAMGNDFKNISLYHNTLDHILEHHYGTKFNQSLTSVDTMQHVCVKTCQHNISKSTISFIGVRVSTRKETA